MLGLFLPMDLLSHIMWLGEVHDKNANLSVCL